MIERRMALRSFAAAAFVSILAACAGTGSSPAPTAGVPMSGSSASFMGHQFMPDKKCKSNHGVSVTPCTVTLTVSDPSQTVTVTAPIGTTVSVDESKCIKNGVASVAGAGSSWQVTAGANKGKCDAVFVATKSGKKVGKAKLSITSQV